MTISQTTIDGFLFQGPFCVHMEVEFQKNALPTLFNYVRVRESHQPHVMPMVIGVTTSLMPASLAKTMAIDATFMTEFRAKF